MSLGPTCSNVAEPVFGILQKRLDDPTDTGLRFPFFTDTAAKFALARISPWAFRLAEMRATRRRTFSSIQKLATVDPRGLTATHFAFGKLDLAQWWMLQASHDRQHLQQVRAVKGAREFPRAGTGIRPVLSSLARCC